MLCYRYKSIVVVRSMIIGNERTGSNKGYEEYKKQRHQDNHMRKKAKREYKKLLKRFKNKPKLFYSYVRKRLKLHRN